MVTLVTDQQDKPFVTKDGRIYRRAADSSEPVFENDRYTIDYLYKEGRRFKKYFARLRKGESNLSKGVPWLRATVVPYPDVVDRTETFEVTKVADLLQRSKQAFQIPAFGKDTFQANFPFNTGYTSGRFVNFSQVAPSSGHFDRVVCRAIVLLRAHTRHLMRLALRYGQAVQFEDILFVSFRQ